MCTTSFTPYEILNSVRHVHDQLPPLFSERCEISNSVRISRDCHQLYIQGGNLSGPLALPASSGGIIAVHLLFSQDITIMSLKLAGRASDLLRLPPCIP